MKLLFLLVLVVPALCTRPILGGVRQMSQDQIRQPMAQAALSEGIKKYNAQTNNMFHYALYNVENATIQIVGGVAYKFTATLVPTQCIKSAESFRKTLKDCKIGNGHAERCEISIWSRPWVQRDEATEVTLHKCEPVESLELHENIYHAGLTPNLGVTEAWKLFKQTHNKAYATDEEEKARYEIFCANMKKVQLMSLLEQGSATYGVTPFMDLSGEEFRRYYLSPTWDLSKRPEKESIVRHLLGAPKSFDWREHGAVTPVKNQAQCGSCWAFSTTGNIEGQWFLKKHKLVSLSEQELVDCDKVDLGCQGGLPSQAYKEIIRLGGLETEDDYPYQGENEKCRLVKSKEVVYINSSVAISQDEGKIADWLAQNGPVSIGINAFAMQFYHGGVSHPWSIFCSKKKLDHGVLIVGYGVSDSEEPYWIIKNSWGPSWGEKGYYRIYRGDGSCGLNTMCTSAVVQ